MIELYDYKASCPRCHGSAWECIGEFSPRGGHVQDVLECAYCGVRERVDAPRKRAAVAEPQTHGEFRFQYGRFKGLTFAEADAQPNGRRYLEVLRDTNEKLRDRIKAYIDNAASSA